MNILIEIGHPAHVHFYRRAISTFQEKGHSVHIVTRNKEITNKLLDSFHLPYHCFSTPATSKWALGFELLTRWAKMMTYIKKHKIDVTTSISGISTSLPARLCGINDISFTDTEDATITNKVAFPFTKEVWTPHFFKRELGKNHRRYHGLHELAYLQHFDNNEALTIRQKLALPKNYSIIRLVAYDALHDWNMKGISEEKLHQLISVLKQRGEVFITSQSPLQGVYKNFELQIPIDKIHAVLEGASLFIGESPTMAVESSLLGTPSFLISPRIYELGNMVELEKGWELLKNFTDWNSFFEFFHSKAFESITKQEWEKRAFLFKSKMDDVSQLIIHSVLRS